MLNDIHFKWIIQSITQQSFRFVCFFSLLFHLQLILVFFWSRLFMFVFCFCWENKKTFFFISISRLIYNHYYYDSHSLFLMENINQIHSISIFTYSNNNKILSNTHTHTHSKPIMIHHNWHEYIEWIQTNELIIKQTDQNEWIYAWIILEDFFVLFCYCPFCLPDFFPSRIQYYIITIIVIYNINKQSLFLFR